MPDSSPRPSRTPSPPSGWAIRSGRAQLGHPPPEVPDAESVEVDHHLIHILGPELALRLLPQWRVGEALVQQNDATNVECVV